MNRGFAPRVFRLMGRVERELDVGGRGAGNLAKLVAGDRARIVEIAAFDGGDPFAADEIVVAVANENLF
jgi:hypothetical protein